MKIIKIFLILLTITPEYLQKCGKGCLSCKKDTCLFCNNLRLYSLNSLKTSCEPNNIPNCRIFKDNICLECSENYYNKLTDQNKVECVQGITIENCQKMKGYYLCERCKKGFEIVEEGKKCRVLNNVIQNCLSHYYRQNEVLCELCDNGFVISADQKSCGVYKSDANCLISSNFYCGACDAGFEIKRDFLNSFENFEIDGSFVNDVLSVREEPYRQTSLIRCSNTVSHCLLFEEIEIEESGENEDKKLEAVCKRCENQYYVHQVDNKTVCLKSEEIINCDIYSENKICQFCRSGFYLKDNECLNVKNENLIQYCLYYKNEEECLQCKSEFKLVDKDTHEELKLKMTLINTAIDTSKSEKETPKNPKETPALTNQLEKILTPNIIDFIHLHTQQENTERDLLEKDYLKKSLKIHLKTLNPLKVPQCIRNTIPNCSQYKKGDCQNCSENYYLLNSQCIELKKPEIVENCAHYSPEKICVKCKNGYLNYNNLCFRMNPIHNCRVKVFQSQGRCLLCKKGYYFDKANLKCVEFSNMSKSNCLVFSDFESRNCLLCDSEYFMNGEEVCVYEQEIPYVRTRVLNISKALKLV